MESISQPRKGMSLGYIFLVLYLGILFFEPQQFFPALEQIRIAYSFGIFVLCWAIVFSLTEVKGNIFRLRLFHLLILFFLFCTLSLIVSELPVAENPAYMELSKATVLFLIVALIVRTKIDFIRLCWILVIFTTINAVVTIYYYHLGALPYRMVSFFGSLGRSGSNEFALLMVEMLPFPILLLQERRSKVPKIFLLFSILTFIYCITRTRSRAGFLGVMLIFLVLTVYRYVNFKLFILILMALVLVFIKSPGSYFRRIQTVVEAETYDYDSNIRHRFKNYERAFNTITEKPLLGIGIGGFQAYIGLLDPYEERRFVIHNTFLEVAAESGIPAAILFSAMLVYTFWRLKEVRENLATWGKGAMRLVSLLNAMRVALLTYAFMAMSLSIRHNRILFILIALTCCLQRFSEDQQDETKFIKTHESNSGTMVLKD